MPKPNCWSSGCRQRPRGHDLSHAPRSMMPWMPDASMASFSTGTNFYLYLFIHVFLLKSELEHYQTSCTAKHITLNGNVHVCLGHRKVKCKMFLGENHLFDCQCLFDSNSDSCLCLCVCVWFALFELSLHNRLELVNKRDVNKVTYSMCWMSEIF